MYAIVRIATYDPAAVEKGQKQLDEFQEVHASQPGYAGTVVVDVGDGRWVTVNVWDSQESATAALPRMIPVVQRQVEPLLVTPSEMIGAGRVVFTDLKKDASM